MFAILFSKGMDPFYAIFLSYPTILFSALIVLCVLFCLIAVLGVIDFDFLNFDMPDIDGPDLGLNSGADGVTNAHVLASLLMRLGLVGIPAPIILFSISLIGWMISFTLSYYVYDYVPDGFLQFIMGTVILVGVLYVSAYLTGIVLKPFKVFFETANQEVQKEIIGKLAVIRTSKANATFGEAVVEDGGAGLIVKVRSYKDETFKRGDRVILLEYAPAEHIYKIISEQDFNN